eukprot:gene12746-20739_t
MLKEAKQEIPAWFEDLPECRNHNQGAGKDKNSNKWGGRDARPVSGIHKLKAWVGGGWGG